MKLQQKIKLLGNLDLLQIHGFLFQLFLSPPIKER